MRFPTQTGIRVALLGVLIAPVAAARAAFQEPEQPEPIAISQQMPELAWPATSQPAGAESRAAASDTPEAAVGSWLALSSLWPDLGGPALTWFAVVVILLLTFQTRPLLALRNLDGLVLAGTCLLLALRSDTGLLPGGVTGKTWQWWAYLGLTAAAVYWLARGVVLLWGRKASAAACNVAPGAMWVLLVVGLTLSFARIGTAPLSAGSRDGLMGGTFFAQHGKLPYGDTQGADARSPLLYLLHAGAVRAVAAPAELDWTHVAEAPPVGEDTRLAYGELASRVVNGVLLVAMIVGVYLIGRRLHSAGLGLTMVVILTVFPGALECLSRPQIMLPTALLTWSLALALMPGVGGLLSTLLMVAAGLAWPWAWLGLPVLMAHFLRRGWHLVGATVGTLGAAAGCLAGLTLLTAPAIPRAAGALAAAGLQPDFSAQTTEDGTLVIDTLEPTDPADVGLAAPLWKFLVEIESTALHNGESGPGAGKLEMPNGVDVTAVRYRSISAAGDALHELQRTYRVSVGEMPQIARMWVALRTVLEATWLGEQAADAPTLAVWDLWADGDTDAAAGGFTPRRTVQSLCIVIVLVAAGLLLFERRTQPHNLVGGVLIACSATLLAGRFGAVTDLVWIAPAVLAALATRAPGSSAAKVQKVKPRLARLASDSEPAPRVSVEN